VPPIHEQEPGPQDGKALCTPRQERNFPEQLWQEVNAINGQQIKDGA
jgi:hypothetical protein